MAVFQEIDGYVLRNRRLLEEASGGHEAIDFEGLVAHSIVAEERLSTRTTPSAGARGIIDDDVGDFARPPQGRRTGRGAEEEQTPAPAKTHVLLSSSIIRRRRRYLRYRIQSISRALGPIIALADVVRCAGE